MRHLIQKVQQGWAATVIKGRFIKNATIALTMAGFFTVLAPAAKAVTQLEFLQWMVQLTGDNAQFSAESTGADYVQWARARGMNPNNGWTPGSALTPTQLAQALVQLYGLDSRRYGYDYFRVLEREGIVVDRRSGQVSRSALAGLIDEFGFQNRMRYHCRRPTSPKGDRDDDDDDRGGGHGNGHGHGNNHGDDDDDRGHHSDDDDDDRGHGRNNHHNRWRGWRR